MAIVLPFPLTIQEIRVLQEYRRVGAETLSGEAIRGIKHPGGSGEDLISSLLGKGFVTAAPGGSGFSLTDAGKALLARDVRPGGEESGPAPETA